MGVLLAELNRCQVKERVDQDAVVVLPVGAIEQHGEHLPLDTDAFLISEVAKAAAEQAYPETPVLVAPTVNIGCSLHHMQYPGTLSLEYETFISAICEIAACFARHGFSRMLLLNGHGGNTASLTIAANKLMVKNVLKTVVAANYWSLIQAEVNNIRESCDGGMGHACEFETSLSMFLRPQLVQQESMVRSIPKPRLTGDSLDLVKGGSVILPWIVHKDTPSGVVGDPMLATAEKGEKIFQASTMQVARLIQEIYMMKYREAD